jgi:sulfate transport system permease protein
MNDQSLSRPLIQSRELRTQDQARNKWGALFLFSIAWIYVGAILVVPLVTLGGEVVRVVLSTDVVRFFTGSSLEPLLRSFQVTAIVVGVNAIVGVGGALVLVRRRFPGRAFLNALVDLPLAVSPVMIGLGVLLVVGRDGWFGPFFESLGIRLTFSFPGLIIATLFVTLPYTLREVAYVLEEL